MTMRAIAVYPWRLVTDVSTRTRNAADATEGDLVIVTVRDVGPLATPLRRSGPDFIGRGEAFTMAAMAVERWWRDARRLGQVSD
jgi:hypothetical protein